MCGIAGIVLNPNQQLPDLRERLTAMRDVMAHRGPDDAGLWLSPDGRVGLASRRLAIQDISPAGHMPMGREDATLWITYNGEVYNAEELRAPLQRLGYAFRSSSDTEVILEGYHAWGGEVLERLRGMFALAICRDDGEMGGEVVLARDPLGIKPLFYAETTHGLVFASELKGILASGLVSREIDPAALVAYLMMGSVPSPLTIFREIRALEPGWAMRLPRSAPVSARQLWRYWTLPRDERAPSGDPVAEVRALLQDAVGSHLVSDVPLGAFLSGGLDSSAVVALMRTLTNGPIRTCSMVFEEASYSEAPYARAVAEALGTEHYERVITAQDVAGEMGRILWAMDQPSIDGVNSYFVSRTAREAGLTVALSGLGGDEIFGGYSNTFQGIPKLLRALRVAHGVPGGPPLARQALGLMSQQQQRWAKVSDALARPPSPASAYLVCRGLFAPAEVQALVKPEVWAEAAERFDPVAQIVEGMGDAGGTTRQALPSSYTRQPFAWVSRAELRTYTHHQLLRDTDVMSMAHSLEVRVPLLDQRLVTRVLQLPASAKENGAPKSLLLKAVGDMLPPLVRERREKRGFVFPFDIWLRGPLRDYAHPDRATASWLQPEGVSAILRAYEQGSVHWSRAWGLAVLNGWAAANV